MAKAHKMLKVRFTQQQMQLLDNLKKEGSFGRDYGEIVANIFRDHIKQEFGKGGS